MSLTSTKSFYFFRNIAADKSVPYAVDFPHRAIKIIGSSFLVVVFHRFSGNSDFMAMEGEYFTYFVGFISVHCFGLSGLVFQVVFSVGPLPPVNKVNILFNE